MKVSTGIFTTGVHAITKRKKPRERGAQPLPANKKLAKHPGRYRRGSTTITPEKQALFLRTLAEGWSPTRAAEVAECPRQTFAEFRDNNEVFAAAWTAAEAAGTESLEDEAKRRATVGVKEAIYYQGEVVGHQHRPSDVLLMFQLNGRKPEKYRQNVKLDATVSTGKDFSAALGIASK